MLKLFIVLCLSFYSHVAMSQTTQQTSANVHDDNHYIMIGASVSIVEGISSTANTEQKEVDDQPKHIVEAQEIEEVENAAEGLSASVVPK